jgi:zinc/manganese transport system substrate-binding protein
LKRLGEAVRGAHSAIDVARRDIAQLPSSVVRTVLLTAALLVAALAALIGPSGCGGSGGGPSGPTAAGSSVSAASSRGSAGAGRGKLEVVAAENFWGSIAAQLAGDRARVTSIIVNPSTDPHSYEPTAQDARTIANAKMVIVNGIGYDNWAPKLLGASPLDGRVVLNVGDLLGLKDGDNPHRWYSPSNVHAVVDQIVADLDKLDPPDAAYFAQQKQAFETRGLARYDQLRRQIRARFAGVPVGYSESIVQPLGEDLGLNLLTPESFARAIAEGADVTAKDKQAVDAQARDHQIKVWIFNSQNVTPDVQRVNQIAAEQKIPIATVTETLAPASATFEQWQVSQLEGIMRALRQSALR